MSIWSRRRLIVFLLGSLLLGSGASCVKTTESADSETTDEGHTASTEASAEPSAPAVDEPEGGEAGATGTTDSEAPVASATAEERTETESNDSTHEPAPGAEGSGPEEAEADEAENPHQDWVDAEVERRAEMVELLEQKGVLSVILGSDHTSDGHMEEVFASSSARSETGSDGITSSGRDDNSGVATTHSQSPPPDPSIVVEVRAVRAGGGEYEQHVQRILRRRLVTFRRCFDDERVQCLDENSVLQFSFAISEQGGVEGGSIAESSYAANTNECVLRALGRLRFPMPEEAPVPAEATLDCSVIDTE